LTDLPQHFLPMSRQEMEILGWEELDFILVSGDAYVDHPTFGAAMVARILEADGYRVGIIAQPDWRTGTDFMVLGRPRLGFLVTGGNMDSMVSNYTVAGKPRRNDSFCPGGIGGKRPDRATLVYCTRIRENFKKTNIVIGGIEASLRRMAHYDYWSNKVRRSILLDSKADLLVYGMAEGQIREIASRLATGEKAREMTDIRGTVYRSATLPQGQTAGEPIVLPEFDHVRDARESYAKSFLIQYHENDAVRGKTLVEPYGEPPAGQYIVQNPPPPPLETAALDRVYALPFQRTFHPSYEIAGGVPAISEVQYSITSSRGCFGGCSFCALAFHQGRRVQGRSHESIEQEAKTLIAMEGFKGYIHDVGGPTANFRSPSCKLQLERGLCEDKQCLYPGPCKNLDVDHSDYLTLLRRLRKLPGVKKVFIRSGIRFDYLTADPDGTFFRELVEHHVSGQLKVAPEHVDPTVLKAMGKPGKNVFDRFSRKFYDLNAKLGKKQFLVPYFISSHPGADLSSAIALAEYQREHSLRTEQVQDFYPTPGTLSTCMYHTGLDPRSMKPIHVPKDAEEKQMQRALLQFFKPENHQRVRKALALAGRTDLIGRSGKCLVPPESYRATRSAVDRPPARGKPSNSRKGRGRGPARQR
jgi:uncharacterized radical SAM protein YgiQ